MSDLHWFADKQVERLRPVLPQSHGKRGVNDRQAWSGIAFINRYGLRL